MNTKKQNGVGKPPRSNKLLAWLIALIGSGIFFVFAGAVVFRWLTVTTEIQGGGAGVMSKGAQVRPEAMQGSDSGERSQERSEEHPLDTVLQRARESLALHRREHRDYRATVVKQERIGKQLSDVVRMALKLRYREASGDTSIRPVDVYLKFLEPKGQAGREVIWSQGLNENLMRVHEAGFLNVATVELAPTSRLAMIGNRYPISDIGIEKLLEKLLERGERDRMFAGCEVIVQENVQVAGRICTRIEVLHRDKELDVAGGVHTFDFYRAVIDLDVELGIPIHYASYLWPLEGQDDLVLDEEFTYEDLEFNVGLTDEDFDPENPAYNYP